MKEAVEEGAGGIVPPLRGGQFFFKKKIYSGPWKVKINK
jgi:hypothetical protein